MSEDKRYPAKVLLFGEHTILRGSRALAEPLPAYFSRWEQGYGNANELTAFAHFLATKMPGHFEIKRFLTDLDQAWYLASTIPIGYGLGSSGSVCVAVFDRYATEAGRALLTKVGAKQFFAQMESYFHGASSGTDPLIVYVQETLELFPDGHYETPNIQPLRPSWKLFLLDTQQPRQTTTFVNYFTERFDTDAVFQANVNNKWIPATNQAIDAYKTGDAQALQMAFRSISEFQLTHLPPMVIPAIRPVWQIGLKSEVYTLKICGAGGGGCCLGLTADWQRTRELLSDWQLIEFN